MGLGFALAGLGDGEGGAGGGAGGGGARLGDGDGEGVGDGVGDGVGEGVGDGEGGAELACRFTVSEVVVAARPPCAESITTRIAIPATTATATAPTRATADRKLTSSIQELTICRTRSGFTTQHDTGESAHSALKAAGRAPHCRRVRPSA